MLKAWFQVRKMDNSMPNIDFQIWHQFHSAVPSAIVGDFESLLRVLRIRVFISKKVFAWE